MSSTGLYISGLIGIALAAAAVLVIFLSYYSEKGSLGSGFKDTHRFFYGLAGFFGLFAIIVGTSKIGNKV
jgi:hypothetical protein